MAKTNRAGNATNNTEQILEERIRNLKGIYDNVEKCIDQFSDVIPEGISKQIKKSILGDQELRDLMEGIEKRRPPRIMMVGRTGVGKSSVINALCGCYVAEVSDIRSCTNGINFYSCRENDRTLMEILDSRGISENTELKADITAEEELLEETIKFAPDAILFVLRCDSRDSSINEDLDFLIKIRKQYYAAFCQEVPIIVVLNRADTVAPARLNIPSAYNDIKKKNIEEICEEYRRIIESKRFKANDIIAVSSLIDWQINDGGDIPRELRTEDIRELSAEERAQLEICFDGRYQIDELRDSIENTISDYEARMGFMMALKLDNLVLKLARKIRGTFSAIAASVAALSIPLSDYPILLAIQTIMVSMIASLSGRTLSIKAAKEFLISIGGMGVIGYGCRFAAQEGVKLLNLVAPGGGSVGSALIAETATREFGTVAINYYIKDEKFEDLKKLRQEKDA